MELHCYHWQPYKAFHFGQRGVGIEASGDHAPSDTIFSAICHTLRHLYGTGTLESFLEACQSGSPPFLVSGGFPFVLLDGKPLRFYPAPMSLRNASPDERDRFDKKMFKAHWVSETIFKAYVQQGKLRSAELFPAMSALTTPDERDQIMGAYGKAYQQEQKTLRLWVVDDVPRVALDRVTNASNIYRAGLVTFAEGGGLWVGVQQLDAAWYEFMLPTVMTALGDEGIGGERSSGYGQFQVRQEWTVVHQYPDAAQSTRFITLSHYRPASDDEAVLTLGERSAYGLDVRRGWMGSPESSALRRRAVRMVTIGSVLQSIGGQHIYGSLANVTPDNFTRHDVWRSGLALPIGLGN